VRDLVMNEGRSLLVRDARLDQDFGTRFSIVAQEIRSILAVPLQTDERVIGLLYLDSPNFVREFTAEDLNLVTVMANIAAIRIEHARLMEQEQARKLMARELDRAAEIQRRLLPSEAPEIPGFDLAGYNAPCRTVGGDYYDFLTYADGGVALFIGDVSGKGLGAALLMSSLQARVHVLFEDRGSVAAQISRLNRSVAANCPGNCFITLFAAVLDPATGDLVYCNAGHNPPLLVRSSDEVELLPATGLPLGINRDAAYEQNSCRLEHSDVLVLFSDGVTEACAPETDDEFGEQRLISVIRENRNYPAASLIEAVNAELFSFTSGTAAADDITLVIARRS
jgi:serine phosphatase RsbU (regulator of sigma subunit)